MLRQIGDHNTVDDSHRLAVETLLFAQARQLAPLLQGERIVQ